MSDVDLIFVALISLYLIETMFWLKPGSLAFSRVWGRFRSPLSPIKLIGNDAGTLVLGGPLTSDASFLCEPLPISISPAGVVSFVPAAPLQTERRRHPGAEFSWTELKALRLEDRSLMINQRFVCQPRNARSARYLCDTLLHLADLGDSQRSELIVDLFASTLDLHDTRQRLDLWKQATRRLRLAAGLLFLWTIPLGMALYYELITIPVPRNWQVLIFFLAILAVLWGWAIIESYFAHRELLPEDASGRSLLLFTSLVSPVVPMRNADRLARELFLFVHPLALAAAINNQPILEVAARDTVRDLKYPLFPEMPDPISEAGRSIIDWSNSITTTQVKQLMSELNIDFNQMLAAPPRVNPQAQSYCPRCHDDYTVAAAFCSRCGDRPTIRY
ncbi:MAG: hypothetical protein ACK6DS_16235 [Planctomycetota bacterium]